MRRNKTIQAFFTFVMAAMFIIGFTACGGGQSGGGENGKEQEESHEHPENGEDHEHPDEGGEEHPDEGGEEHPDESSSSQSMTIEEFADAAKAHIQKKAEKNNGHFQVKDQKTGKKLKLDLKKVHRKRLSHLGDNRYFVCADFESQDGTLYDVDIFMEGTQKSNLEQSGKPMVHKVEGEPRFTYYQEDGVWRRKPVEDNQTEASAS